MLADDAQPHDENRKLAKHLYAEKEALFTFLTHDGVDATNWRAEQAIRPAVVNRKVWGGNRTWRGAATQARMMSLIRTAAQQNLDVIEFLTRLARDPRRRTYRRFSRRTTPPPLVIHRDGLSRDPLSKYLPLKRVGAARHVRVHRRVGQPSGSVALHVRPQPISPRDRGIEDAQSRLVGWREPGVHRLICREPEQGVAT